MFAERRVYTVSQLTEAVKRSLEAGFRDIEVRGQVSNFKPNQTSGHWYFTLKDSRSQLRAVFFSQFNRLLRFNLENGLDVQVRGRITVYERNGDYQIAVDTLSPVGTGSLQLAFEQMRKRLSAEGLFDPSRKRKLPALPRRIAVVTSLDGAVCRDILNILARRHSSLPVLIFPVHVQGDGAAGEIATAIQYLNQRAHVIDRPVDVIILARGGGSAEDLWAFNEERLARAIAKSEIPIISAVGHETDITIADLVADVRAATPSAAAEIVVPAVDELRARVTSLQEAMRRVVRNLMLTKHSRLNGLLASRGFSNCESRIRSLATVSAEISSRVIRSFEKHVDRQKLRLANANGALATTDFSSRLTLSRNRMASLEVGLERAIEMQLARQRGNLAVQAAGLEMLSPLKVLGRGYLLARRPSGQLVTQARSLDRGDNLKLRFADGEVGCEVTETSSEA